VMCVRELLKKKGIEGIGVEGVVCVGCSDGVRMYKVREEYNKKSEYEYVSSVVVRRRKKQKGRERGYGQWPLVYNSCKEIKRKVVEKGYTKILKSRGKVGVLEAVVGGKRTAYGLVYIIKEKRETISQKREIVRESKKAWISQKKKVIVQGIVMYAEAMRVVVTYGA